jgi:hypothetical protein
LVIPTRYGFKRLETLLDKDRESKGEICCHVHLDVRKSGVGCGPESPAAQKLSD